jgi:murein DD-endopeptidase MepM/ murein hydrolase activator NlpD
MTSRRYAPLGAILIFLLLCGCGGEPAGAAPPALTPLTPLPTAAVTATAAPAPSSSPLPELTPSQVPQATIIPTLTATAIAEEPTCGDGWCAYSGHFMFRRPIIGSHGLQVDPTYRYASTGGGTRKPHTGVEFSAQESEPVLAGADGTVVQAGEQLTAPFSDRVDEYGNLVIIKHVFAIYPKPVYSMYGHLSKVEVKVGQAVKAGDEIGQIGDTGLATGPHLHFQVFVEDGADLSPRNPELWLIPSSPVELYPAGATRGLLLEMHGTPQKAATITLERLPQQGEKGMAPFYVKTYDTTILPSDEEWQENFAAGDLPAGSYRASVVAGGKVKIRYIQIFPNRLTVVSFDDPPASTPTPANGE